MRRRDRGDVWAYIRTHEQWVRDLERRISELETRLNDHEQTVPHAEAQP